MSYSYIDKRNELSNSYNFIRKETNKVIQQGEQQIKRTSRFLVDANFDIDEGFKSNGNFSFSIINPKNGNESLSIKSSDFKKDGFQYSFKDKSNKAAISFDSDDNSFITDWVLKNGVSQEQSYREISSGYLQDLDFLYEEYLFSNLRKIFKTEDDLELLSIIKNKKIEDELCFFISDMVDIYNNSYIKNKSKILEDYDNTGYNQAHHRFDICINDNEFQENIKNRLALFENAVNSQNLNNTNIRGDKNISFLDSIKECEESLNRISDELVYRSHMHLRTKNMADSSYKQSISNNCIDECNEYRNNGIITIDEKNKISDLENKIFKGTISKEETREYNKIVSTIQERYTEYLRTFEFQSDSLSRAGFTEVEARRSRTLDGTKGISGLKDYVSSLRTNFKNFEFLQSNELDANLVLQQNQALEREVSRHGEYNEETGEILLDTEKKAVIEKINGLKKLETANLKESQINSLLENDVPALLNIVFKTEALCGLKDFYLNGVQEEDRQALFGEHYHYLSADQFFQILSKKIEEYDKSKDEHIDTVLLADTLKNQLREASQGSPFQKEFREIISYIDKIEPSKLESYFPSSDNKDYNKENIQNLINDSIKDSKNADSEQFKKFLEDVLLRSSSEYEDIKSKNITNNEAKIVNDRFLSKLEDALTHKVGNIKILKYDIEKQLGVKPETLFTEDGSKLDIKKILDLRQKLIHEYKDKSQKLSPEALPSEKAEVSEQARKIVFLEEKLLNYKVERDPETLAVSNKDLKAYSALRKGDIIKKYLEDEKVRYDKEFQKKNENKSIEDLEEELDKKKEELSKLEDAKNAGKHFMAKSRDKKIDTLQEEISKLEKKIDTYYSERKEVYTNVINRLEKEIAIPLTESLENNHNLEQAQKEGKIVKVELSKEIENLKNVLIDINANHNLNEDDANKKLLIVLAAIKEYDSKDLIERIDSNEKTNGDFLLKVINKEFAQFSDDEKKALINSIQTIYDKSNELKAEQFISPDGIRIGIDEIIKKDYSMVPLDVNGSNDLLNALTNGEIPYDVIISTDKNPDLVISNKKVHLFEKFLQNGFSLDSSEEAIRNEIELNFYKNKSSLSDGEISGKVEELNNEFTEIIKNISPKDKENINIITRITDESKKAVLDSINAYGDTKNILIVPPFDKLELSETCMVSINSSNGDNSSLNVVFDKIIDTSDLKKLIDDKSSEYKDKVSNEKTETEEKVEDNFNFDRDEITNAPTLRKALLKLVEDKNNEKVKEELKNFLSKDDSTLFLTPEDFDRFMNDVKTDEKLKIVQNLQNILQKESNNENIKNVLDNLSQIEENLNIQQEKENKEIENVEETEASKNKNKSHSKIREAFYKISGKEKNDELTILSTINEIREIYTNAPFTKDEEMKISKAIDEIQKNDELSKKDKIEELDKILDNTKEVAKERGYQKEDSNEEKKEVEEISDNDKNKNKEEHRDNELE